VVEKSGSWFSYSGERIGQGRENAKNFLRQNPDMANAIEQTIRSNAGILAAALSNGSEKDGDAGDDA
jgi:recombination protein RecA